MATCMWVLIASSCVLIASFENAIPEDKSSQCVPIIYDLASRTVKLIQDDIGEERERGL